MISGTRDLMTCFGLPITSSANATFSYTVLSREQLEVLEDRPDVAAQVRAPSSEVSLAMFLPATWISPWRRLLLADQQPDQGGLARAGRADDEDELALLDVDVDVVERDDRVLVDLGDVIEFDHDERGLLSGERRLGNLPRPYDASKGRGVVRAIRCRENQHRLHDGPFEKSAGLVT